METELLMQFAPQLLKFGLGALQGAGGLGGMLSNKRPQFEIPAAAKQALSIANMRANSNMPNYNNAVQNAQLTTANQLSAAKESGNPLTVLPQLQANENAAMRGIENKNMQYHDNAVQNQQQQLQRQADYQEQQFQVNEFAPYADKQNRSNQLIGAGLSNITGALDSAASAMMMNKLLGQQKERNNWYDQAAKSGNFMSSVPNVQNFQMSNNSQLPMNNNWLPTIQQPSYGGTQIGIPTLNSNSVSFMPRFGRD